MPMMFLVGNKKELLCESAYQFVEEQAINMAKELNAEYWAVSAQTGENVHELFDRIAALTFQEMIWREIEDNAQEKCRKVSYSNFIKLTREKSSKKKHCVSVTCS